LSLLEKNGFFNLNEFVNSKTIVSKLKKKGFFKNYVRIKDPNFRFAELKDNLEELLGSLGDTFVVAKFQEFTIKRLMEITGQKDVQQLLNTLF
jgi:hypothetical protein